MRVKTLVDRLAVLGWRSVALRALVLAGGWVILNQGDRASFAFGLPVVILALGASLFLPSPPPARWSATGLVRYLFAFLLGSLLGGIDVARRALSPARPLAPAMLRYGLRLRSEPGRQLFAGTLSLLPGTLSVAIDGDALEIHVLGNGGDGQVRQLRDLETLVARAVGERLEGGNA